MKNKFLGLVVGGALAATASGASAAPILAVDLDATTAMIDSVLMVPIGTPLMISIVAFDDGLGAPILVDTVSMGVSTSVPGVASIGAPTMAGAFAASIFLPLDLGSGAAVGPGSPLTPLPAPAPTPGADTGIVGYFSAIGSAGAAFLPIGSLALGGVSVLDLAPTVAASVGPTTFSIFGFPAGSELNFSPPTGPGPLFPTLVPGFLTVFDPGPPPNGIPEPGTMLLFGVGLLGLAGLRRRRTA